MTVYDLCSCAACFFAQVTIDASNNYGLASRKDAQTPTKSGSSGELGSLCWQMEVGAVVTSEFEGAVGLTNIILMTAETTMAFTSFLVWCRMENSARALQTRVTEVAAVTAASTCLMAALPWLPHRTASLLKTCCPACVRREASHWKMLSFTFKARTRWVHTPLPYTDVLWIFKQTPISLINTVAAAIITGPGLFCPQRPAGHLRAQSEVCVSQHFLPFIFLVFVTPADTHTHILNTARPLWQQDRPNMSEFILDFLLKYCWGSAISSTSGLHVASA